MAKKVTNIVKKNKEDNNSSELFNLNEEIIIGINSKNVDNKALKNNKKNNSKKNSFKKNNSQNNNIKKNNYTNNNFRKNNEQSNNLPKNNSAIKNSFNIKDNLEEKEKKKLHKFLKIFILLFLLLLSIVILLLSPLFNINKVTVVNNKKISSEEIISLSGIQIGENTFKYVNFDIIEKIKKNPYIDDVKITRSYPSEIIIEVTERAPQYFFKFGESNAYINTQGYIIEISNESYQVPEIIGLEITGKSVIVGDRLNQNDLLKLEKIIEIYNNMVTNEIHHKVVSFTIEDDRIIITLNDNKLVYIEDFTNINIKILSLKVVLERNEGKSGEIYLDGQGETSSPLFRESVWFK